MKLAIGILFCGTLSAEALSPEVLRLLGDDAVLVTGYEVGRYEESKLGYLSPTWASPHLNPRVVKQFVGIEVKEPGAGYRVSVLESRSTVERLTRGRKDPSVRQLAGFEVAQFPGDECLAVLNGVIVVEGNARGVGAALSRWSQAQERPSRVAEAVLRLSSKADNWIWVSRPFERENKSDPTKTLKYRDDLVKAVESFEGGLRTGELIEVFFEATFASGADAAAAAQLARFLPGLLQLNGQRQPTWIAEATENLDVHSRGRVASGSATVSAHKLWQYLVEADKQPH